MATPNDQPHPDLDTAIDAVLPSLTAVGDEIAAGSLRRTRIALAEARGVTAGGHTWRWAVATAAVLLVLGSSLALWRSRTPAPGSSVERRPANPVVVPAAPAPAAPQVMPVPVVPQRLASAEPAARRPDWRRGVPVRATSAPVVVDVPPRPDPLIALVRAVQQIPEAAWRVSASRNSDAPVTVPEVSIPPIVVPSIETTAEVHAESIAPGEP
ncbi:MAG: hypothetical protein ABIT71_01450 [Vicinamibacteraceae bacterium]